MAEGGTVASLIGVAGAGFRLSLLLNAVSCEVASANAGFEVHGISKSVTLFSMMLKQTGHVLRGADSVHSREAVETAKSIAEEGTRVFEEIQDMLDRVSTKNSSGTVSPSIQQRFRWCFKKHRVTYLLAQLESLKLSLSVMLQVIQLGKLMASASRSDPPDEVARKTEAMKQERAEAQNAVIVRYWQMSTMDRLFEASQREEEEDRQASINHDTMQDDGLSRVTSDSSQQTTEPTPPEFASSMALVRLPVFSLGELDHTLHQIKDSPRDMVQVSDSAINPLLERWTNWREIRERRHRRESGGRYVPSVHDLDENDEDLQLHDRYGDREDSPRGYYLEGPTSDWRKPNSASARHEAFVRRKQYSGYQPSVSAASSDMEDSPSGSPSSKKRTSKRHIIDSGSESSASEPDIAQPKPRRQSSSGPAVERKTTHPGPDGLHPLAHTYTAPVQPPPGWATANNSTSGGMTSNRAPSVTSAQSGASRLSSPAYHPPGHRPWATPDQNAVHHHSLSSPLPPVVHAPTASANPYAAVFPPPPGPSQQQQPAGFSRFTAGSVGPGQLTPYSHGPGHGQVPASSTQRYMPPAPPPSASPWMGLPPRPVSQDGKAPRSPSRLSQSQSQSQSHSQSQSQSQAPHGSTSTRGSHTKASGGDDEKRKATKHSSLREGATKGLLGAGAIAGFLEALEGLSI